MVKNSVGRDSAMDDLRSNLNLSALIGWRKKNLPLYSVKQTAVLKNKNIWFLRTMIQRPLYFNFGRVSRSPLDWALQPASTLLTLPSPISNWQESLEARHRQQERSHWQPLKRKSFWLQHFPQDRLPFVNLERCDAYSRRSQRKSEVQSPV